MKLIFGIFCLLALPVLGNDVVPGFEDQKVYEQVMAGKIMVEEVLATDLESTFVIRAFIPKATSDQYVDVATDHKKYPVWFSEVKDAKTKSVNADRTEWTYWMDIVVKYLIFSKHIYPEGRQVYTRPADAISEGVLTHTVDNYGDVLEKMLDRARLIPHEGGILVHDYINYRTRKADSSANIVRTKLKEQFVRFMTAYRKALTGREAEIEFVAPLSLE